MVEYYIVVASTPSSSDVDFLVYSSAVLVLFILGFKDYNDTKASIQGIMLNRSYRQGRCEWLFEVKVKDLIIG